MPTSAPLNRSFATRSGGSGASRARAADVTGQAAPIRADGQNRGVLALALLGAVRGYQVLLSPIVGGACRFEPSCSRYMVEAIERHGAARGAWLGARRLARCHPFGSGGFDPVPEAENHSGSDFPQAETENHSGSDFPYIKPGNHSRSG